MSKIIVAENFNVNLFDNESLSDIDFLESSSVKPYFLEKRGQPSKRILMKLGHRKFHHTQSPDRSAQSSFYNTSYNMVLGLTDLNKQFPGKSRLKALQNNFNYQISDNLRNKNRKKDLLLISNRKHDQLQSVINEKIRIKEEERKKPARNSFLKLLQEEELEILNLDQQRINSKQRYRIRVQQRWDRKFKL